MAADFAGIDDRISSFNNHWLIARSGVEAISSIDLKNPASPSPLDHSQSPECLSSRRDEKRDNNREKRLHDSATGTDLRKRRE